MQPLHKLFLAVILAVSLGVAALQLPALGAARDEAYDATTSTDMRAIWSAVSEYASDNDKLPATLDALKLEDVEHPLKDYRYTKKSTNTYELCATFKTEKSTTGIDTPVQTNNISFYEDFSDHPKGEHCFTLKASVYSSNSNTFLDDYCSGSGISENICESNSSQDDDTTAF